MDFSTLIEQAKAGNRASLEKIIREIQDKVYGLALRMLYNPADADDATQEILIRIITNLDSFKGKSLFTTWVYKVAANYLLRYKQVEKRYSSTFLKYEEGLELESSSKWEHTEFDPEDKSYFDEIRISCLQGLLLCLSRELRITFLLVDIFGINSTEGAEILDVSAAVFRKRLSRARGKLQSFLFKNCSVVKQNNLCKCGYHVSAQLHSGRFDKENILFAKLPGRLTDKIELHSLIDEMDELNQIGFLYKTNPAVKAPDKFVNIIREIINSGKFTFFNN
ncbi:MAG: RNA polymerase sigma factor [Ignavibacteriales bacterium]